MIIVHNIKATNEITLVVVSIFWPGGGLLIKSRGYAFYGRVMKEWYMYIEKGRAIMSQSPIGPNVYLVPDANDVPSQDITHPNHWNMHVIAEV